MATQARAARVAALIKQEIAGMILKGIKDPRVKMATVSEVEVSADLKHAKVWVQVLGDTPARLAAVEGMRHAAGFVKHELKHRLSLRAVPELSFLPDETAEKADRVMGLLAEAGRRDEETRRARGELPPPQAASDDDESE